MGTASSDCLSRQIRVLHSSLFNLSECTQKNEEPNGPERMPDAHDAWRNAPWPDF
jgi:hypothetical protein